MAIIRPENTQTVWNPYSSFPFASTGVGLYTHFIWYEYSIDREGFETGEWFSPAIIDRLEVIPFGSNTRSAVFQIGFYLENKLVTSTIPGLYGYNGQPIQLMLKEPFELYPAMEVTLGFYFENIELTSYAITGLNGGAIAAKKFKKGNAVISSLPAELPTAVESEEEQSGPVAIAFRGPTPVKPKKPLLQETQRQIGKVIARQYPMDSVAAIRAQFGGIRVYETAHWVGEPLAQQSGMNVDDVSGSAKGRVVAGVRGYFLSAFSGSKRHLIGGSLNLEKNAFIYSATNGLTVEALTMAEPNGAAFWLYSNAQMRVVINGRTIEYSLFFTGGTKKLIATNALSVTTPQLIQCIYNPTTKKMTVWVDGVEKSTQAATGALPTEAKVTATGTLNKTATITALSVNPFTVGIGPGSIIEGAPGIAASFAEVVEILSTTSVKISALATESKVGAALSFFLGETLLMPEGTTTTEGSAQDIAIYESALSKARIEEHYSAFKQFREDPAHMLV